MCSAMPGAGCPTHTAPAYSVPCTLGACLLLLPLPLSALTAPLALRLLLEGAGLSSLKVMEEQASVIPYAEWMAALGNMAAAAACAQQRGSR